MAKIKAWRTENEREVAESYWDTLNDLKFNSRPLIITLTELARDYGKNCPVVIVTLIEHRIFNGHDSVRLPTLYLMDSIIKNHADPYKPLFERGLVSAFAYVFHRSDEKGRSALFKLRNTWTPLFTSDLLMALDLKVQKIDPAWPVAEAPAGHQVIKNKIHVNPAYFRGQSSSSSALPAAPSSAAAISKSDEVRRMEEELLELKKKKLQLEIEAARKAMEEATKSLEPPAVVEPSSSTVKKVCILVN